MFKPFQDFIRGCIIDPALEQKMHQAADEARAAAARANRVFTKAEIALDSADTIKDMIVVAGVSLLVAGFVAGSMSSRQSEPPRS